MQLAGGLAGRLGAPLTVVHIRADPQLLPARMAAGAPILREHSIIAATRLLRSVIDPLLRDLGVSGPTELRTRVEFGDPIERLVRLADELDAACIVVGAAGRGRAGAALLGSVSQGIAARTSRPAIVVPPNAQVKDPGGQAGEDRALVCGIDGSRQSFDATRGHGSLRALVIGSVSRRLAAAARRPVLVVNHRCAASRGSTATPFAAVRREARGA